MALINPVHGLVVPFLCVFTIPLAIFAGITTTLAFSVLMFRVAVVYLDIALAFVPQYFTGRNKPHALPDPTTTSQGHGRQRHRGSYDSRRTSSISPPGSAGSSGPTTPSPVSPFPSGGLGYQQQHMTTLGYRSPGHRRKSSYGFGAAMGTRGSRSRRSSQVSLASMGTITPIHEDDVARGVAPLTEAGLTPSVGMDRDFEGIGGWRLDDRGDDGDWANINSRLELPVSERGSLSIRHHQRSQSVGPVTPTEGTTWLMMKSSTPKEGGATAPSSQEDREWEKNFNNSPGKGFERPNSGRMRMNSSMGGMPSSMTALDPEHEYFGDILAPRAPKKLSA
ncbi:hypothetical protein B0H63DRAFT_131623 [Podospora didyma]|uniref:Uncharacterized protein n=1 Tax=Podospora didyma TaxID=330526 RepID=A0AAE0U515_9PEZI|nr:hypothetical protein B0H63DRAFT_131623 [Podospora didyma]